MAVGPIAPLGPLPAMPNPAAGLASLSNPFIKLSDAMAQLPAQEQQAEDLAETRRKNAMERLQMLQQQVSSNPAIAQNASWQNTVKNLYRAAGVPAPLDEAGNIDVNALTPKTKLAEAFAKDPTLLQNAQGMSADTRKAVFGSGAYDTTGIDPSFWTAQPQYQMAPGERLYMRRQIGQDFQQMASGDLNVDQFLSWVDFNKDALAALGMDPEQLLHSDPQILGKISVAAQAKIQQMEALGILTKDRAQKEIAEIGTLSSLNDLRKAQTKYYTVRADAIPKELQLRQYQIMSNIQLKERALDDGESRLNNAMRNTDLRSLGMRLQAANQLRVSVDAEQREYDNLLNIAKGYATNANGSQAVPQSIIDQLNALKPRLDADRKMIDGARNVQGAVGGIDTPKVTGTHDSTPKPLAGKKVTMSFLKSIAQKYGKNLGDVVKDYVNKGAQITSGTP